MSSIVVSFLFDRLQRRLVSLPVAIVFAVAVLALMPMPAQASAGAQSPQSGGTPATYENGGYNGRGIYPTYRRNARKRPGARYQQYGAHRHNAPRNNCCAHYANPSKKHQDQHHDQDGHDYAKGHHDHGAYHNEGHRHGYDAHRKHDHDKHHKHRGSKYGDNFDPYARGVEDDDEGAAVAESYNGDTTEDKGGVVATESTDEAATDEAMTEDATAEAGTTDDTTTDDATTDATTTDEATTSDGAVASGAPADGSVAPATEGIVQLSSNEELGSYLVDANGRTLYRYDLDTAEASACTGACAQTWVPFTVPADTLLVAGEGVTGSLGAIVRDDGSVQVTYNGSPLYYFADDQQPGDTGGQAVENTWWVVNP